jgi:hypothetical protein
MEELEHDMVDEKKTPKGSKDGSSSAGSGNKPAGCSASSKKVASWASLFQDDDSVKRLEFSEIGSYSCSKFLRDMKAMEAEEDEDDLSEEDDELTTLPESWCQSLVKDEMCLDLPQNLYQISEMVVPSQEKVIVDQEVSAVEQGVTLGKYQQGGKTKWGPTLVNKRPSRGQKDGKSMLAKAQERKKISNLVTAKGKSSMTISLLFLLLMM